MHEHMLRKQQLPIADPWQARAESSVALVCLLAHRRLITLPVFAIRWIRQQIVKALSAKPVARQCAAEEDVVGVTPISALHVEIRLADGIRLRIHLLAEEEDLGQRVHLQQDRVMLFDHPVMAVKLDDGAIAAVFTDLCNAIGLARAPQARRIRSDDTLSGQLYDIEMDPDGSGIRKVDVLTAWAMPTWLTGIQTSRISPDKREAILAFKREAADALYRHFSQLQQLALPPSQEVLPTPTPRVPSRPSEPMPPLRTLRTMSGSSSISR